MLTLVAAGLPASDSWAAHWTGRANIQRAKGKHFRQRHSRAWWRRRRAYLRRKRERARQRRALAAASPNGGANFSTRQRARLPLNVKAPVRHERRPMFDLTLPASWSGTSASSAGEMKFNVRTVDGQVAGTAVLAPATISTASESVAASRLRLLGGVSHTALRRSVIDRMVAEGGWVINDVMREIQGRRVYIVTAQTGTRANEPQQSKTFYFTEVAGRIYSLATATRVELAAPVAAASEQVVATFRVSDHLESSMLAKTPR